MTKTWTAVLQELAAEGFCPGAIAETNDGAILHLISFAYAVDGSLMILGRTDPKDATTWREVAVEDLVLVSKVPTPPPGDAAITSSPEPSHDP